jgi:L-alanine-DL-glutamate epimerase-like enolase superfamily enzyme
MVKIASVEVAHVRVPLDVVTSLSSRVIHERHYVLVRVRDRDGVTGIGACYAGHVGGQIVAQAATDLLEPLVLGREATEAPGIQGALVQAALLHGRQGSIMRAISAIDTAIWDLAARQAGQPMHRYLGAVHARQVPAYASGGYYVDGKGPEALGAEMAGYVAGGFRAVKMKVGRLDPATEEARVRAARDAIGPDILLMLDANNAWSDCTMAMACIRRFEKYDPYWIEEPFGPDDVDNHARLAARTPITVATGEIAAGARSALDLITRGKVAILQSDALVCGGVTEWRKIAAMASAHGIAMAPHWFHDFHAPLLASIDNGLFVEFFPDSSVLNFRKLLDRQLECRDGQLVLHDAPGLGFDFDDDMVKRYAADPALPWTVGEQASST